MCASLFPHPLLVHAFGHVENTVQKVSEAEYPLNNDANRSAQIHEIVYSALGWKSCTQAAGNWAEGRSVSLHVLY